MQDINRDAGEFYNFCLRQAARPRILVNIAADGGHRGEGCELIENFRGADVAGVNDVLGSAQGFERFGTKQAVRVGNNADEDGGSQSFDLSS